MKKNHSAAQVCFFIGLAIVAISFAISIWSEVIAFWVLAAGYLIGGVSATIRLYERVKELDDWRKVLD